jgi:uncharacterized protein
VDGPSTRLRLRVSPGASRSALVGRHGDGWKVRVADAPERGRANDALLAFLARVLDVPATGLELLSGPASRDKVVLVRGLDEAATETRLETAAGAGA